MNLATNNVIVKQEPREYKEAVTDSASITSSLDKIEKLDKEQFIMTKAEQQDSSDQAKTFVKIEKPVESLQSETEKEHLRTMKYKSVNKSCSLYFIYVSILSTLGYTFIFKKPKKVKTEKTKPFIPIVEIRDLNDAVIFSLDRMKQDAASKKIGEDKNDKYRRIKQFVLNTTVNFLIELIERNEHCKVTSGRSKSNVVNKTTPTLRKIQKVAIELNNRTYFIDLSSPEEFGLKIQENLMNSLIKCGCGQLKFPAFSISCSELMTHSACSPIPNTIAHQENEKNDDEVKLPLLKPVSDNSTDGSVSRSSRLPSIFNTMKLHEEVAEVEDSETIDDPIV